MYHPSTKSTDPINDNTQKDYFRLSVPSNLRTNRSPLGEEKHEIKVPRSEEDTVNTTTTAGHRHPVLPLVSPSPRPFLNMSFADTSTVGQTTSFTNGNDDDHKHKNYNYIIPSSLTGFVSSTATTAATDASTFTAPAGNMTLFPSTTSPPNASNFPVPSNIQEEIPYISVDGRRKRRRTTFEDAFHQCLSMTMHEDSVTATSGSENISTPQRDAINDSMFLDEDDKESHQSNDNDEDDDEEEDANDWNIHMNQAYYSSPEAKRYDNVGEISKRLSYHQQDNDNQNSATTNSSHLGGTMWTNSIKVSRMSSTDSLPDPNHDQDEASISSSSTKSDHDNINDSNHDDGDDNDDDNVSSLEELTQPVSSSSLLLAPRKVKKHTEYIDPVDQRIEELIRHSRIKAMVMTQRELERQRQQQRAYERCKMQQMGEKEMDHGEVRGGGGVGESMGVGGGLELRRKNEQEESYFTGQSTDDSVLPILRQVGGSYWGTASSNGSSLAIGGLRRSRSNSIPRGMKYSEFMDVDMSDE